MKRFKIHPGGSARAGSRERFRSLLRMSASGIDIVDLASGVRLERFRPATEILSAQNVRTREDMFRFCHGEQGQKAALNFALYPEATRENLMPKPEDFFAAQFRLLSATTVGAGSWKATDFSDEKVLKASTNMLDRKPVYTNHDTQIENWAGIVTEPKWVPAGKSGKINVPAGINATLLIDTKTRPEIARGVMLGAINSNSVTVEFEWEASHDFKDRWEFVDNIGQMAEDGEMIRRVVTKVTGYHESSLVWLGADPFAKLLGDDGELVHVDAGHVYSKETNTAVKQSYSEKHFFSISSGYDANVLRLALEKKEQRQSKPNSFNMNPKLLAVLLGFLDVKSETEFTDEHAVSLKAALDASEKGKRFEKLAKVGEAANAKLLDADEANFDRFVGEHTIVSNQRLGELVQADKDLKAAGDVVKLKRELTEANIANASLAATAELGKTYLAAKCDQLIAFYNKAVGTKAEAAVIETFKKATNKELDAFLRQYTDEVGMKFSATCTKCNSSENISMQSSIPTDAPKVVEEGAMSMQDMIEARQVGNFGYRK